MSDTVHDTARNKALALFSAPQSAQGDATPEAKPPVEAPAPRKTTCYTATPSGSRLPRKVCVNEVKSKPKAEDDKAAKVE